MLGFYVHIPFCARRCPYCDFAIDIGSKADFRAAYVQALRQEIEFAIAEQKKHDANSVLSSIYCGGGTPTELHEDTLAGLLQLIFENISVAPHAEITIEANPENLSFEKLKALRAAGFNRLSLGAQSFDDNALHLLGRRHGPRDIERVVEQARAAEWPQISVDLIYAVPGQNRDAWQKTLRRAVDLQLDHISCYSLTIESGTPFARRVEKGRLVPVEDDLQADFMSDAMEILCSAGISRYEVSNYARCGCESQHNLNYWRGGDYLAAGCGAHGHRAGHRWWNERNAQSYTLKMQQNGSARVGEEFLSASERLSELVLLGLRLREGLNLQAARELLNFDVAAALHGAKAWPFLTAQGVLREENQVLYLNPQSWPVADAVAVQLLS